jgi:polyhydroxyalkanoate synthesis regulator phasin
MTQDGKRRLDELLREAWATALGGGPGAANTPGGPPGSASIKQRLQHLLDLTQEETTHLWLQFSERVRKNSDELERRLEERFRAAVTLLSSPLQAEVRALRSRAEELGQKLEKFTRGRAEATAGGDSKEPSAPGTSAGT